MTSATKSQLDRFQRGALIAGGVGVGLSIIGTVLDRAQFVQSYLVSYLFWFSIAAGCLPLLLLHYLAGGRWGYMIRRFLEAGVRTLPLMALLFLPLLIDLPALYPWARPELVQHDALLQHKSAYLNVPFFILRAMLYFSIWIMLGRLACRWGEEQERRRDVSFARRLRGLGALGVGLYGLATTFAAIDWAMSLEPHWFSTMYGLLFVVGQILAALGMVIICLWRFQHDRDLQPAVKPEPVGDLGNLLLTFVMLWAYMAFSQYLIIWSGNLREEVPWYLQRFDQGWHVIAIVLVVFHFAVPFLILLSPDLKTNPRQIAKVASGLLVMRALDMYWNVAPAFADNGPRVHWLDATTLIGVGGLWVGSACRHLKTRSLLPGYDARVHADISNE